MREERGRYEGGESHGKKKKRQYNEVNIYFINSFMSVKAHVMAAHHREKSLMLTAHMPQGGRQKS